MSDCELKPHIVISIGRDDVESYWKVFGTTFIYPYKLPFSRYSLEDVIEMGMGMECEYLSE